MWITPQQALRDAEAGSRTVVFPTKMNLKKLTSLSHGGGAVAASRSTPVIAVMPRIE